MRVDIDVYGDDVFARDLIRFGERPSNMAPVWNDVEDYLGTAFERNFADEGPGWAPLRPSTIRSRIAQGYPPGPILTRTGNYRRQMTTNLQTHKTNEEMTVVAPDVPGKFHQMGTSKMVSRPLRLRENEKQDIVKIIQRYIIEGYR